MEYNTARQLVHRLATAYSDLESADEELQRRGGGANPELIVARDTARQVLERTLVDVIKTIQDKINADARDPAVQEVRERADAAEQGLNIQPPANGSAGDRMKRNKFVEKTANALMMAIRNVEREPAPEAVVPPKIGKMTKTYREIYESLTKSPGTASLRNALEELRAAPDGEARVAAQDVRWDVGDDEPDNETDKMYSAKLARGIKKFVEPEGPNDVEMAGGKKRKTRKGKARKSRRRYSRRR